MRTMIRTLLTLAIAAGAHAQNPLTLVGQYDGEAGEDYFGGTLTCGDFNADGYDDFLIGAWGWNDYTGKTYLYLGGPAFPTAPALTIQGQQSYERYALAGNMGDINGDGIDDMALAANAWDFMDPVPFDLLFGGEVLDTLPDWTFHSPLPPSFYITWHADSCGDVNGDGGADFGVFIHSPEYDSVFIFWGGERLDTVPDWRKAGGSRINGLGDVNGDGYADIMIRQYQGPAHIYFGGSPMDTLPDVVFEDGYAYDGIGAGIRDMNGDGYNDVALCWYMPDSTLPRDYIFLGGPEMNSAPDFDLLSWSGSPSRSTQGLSVGDFNGDSLGDIIGVTPYVGGSYAAQIYLGQANFANQSDAVVFDWNEYEFGQTVAAGDINGDGNDELLVTALNYPWFHRGRVYLFQGPEEWVDYGVAAVGPVPPPPSPTTFTLHQNYPNPFNPATTLRFDLPAAGMVRLEVFDTAGRKVSAVGFGEPDLRWYPAGTHEVTFDGSGLPSGVYLVRMEVGGASQVRKVVLLK